MTVAVGSRRSAAADLCGQLPRNCGLRSARSPRGVADAPARGWGGSRPAGHDVAARGGLCFARDGRVHAVARTVAASVAAFRGATPRTEAPAYGCRGGTVDSRTASIRDLASLVRGTRSRTGARGMMHWTGGVVSAHPAAFGVHAKCPPTSPRTTERRSAHHRPPHARMNVASLRHFSRETHTAAQRRRLCRRPDVLGQQPVVVQGSS